MNKWGLALFPIGIGLGVLSAAGPFTHAQMATILLGLIGAGLIATMGYTILNQYGKAGFSYYFWLVLGVVMLFTAATGNRPVESLLCHLIFRHDHMCDMSDQVNSRQPAQPQNQPEKNW